MWYHIPNDNPNMKEGSVMGEKKDKMKLTVDQAEQVTGGTGKSDEAYENIYNHFIGFTEGRQVIDDAYNQIDVNHIGSEPELMQAPQGPLEGLQAILGSGFAPGPTPVPGLLSAGGPSLDEPPPESFDSPPSETIYRR